MVVVIVVSFVVIVVSFVVIVPLLLRPGLVLWRPSFGTRRLLGASLRPRRLLSLALGRSRPVLRRCRPSLRRCRAVLRRCRPILRSRRPGFRRRRPVLGSARLSVGWRCRPVLGSSRLPIFRRRWPTFWSRRLLRISARSLGPGHVRPSIPGIIWTLRLRLRLLWPARWRARNLAAGTVVLRSGRASRIRIVFWHIRPALVGVVRGRIRPRHILAARRVHRLVGIAAIFRCARARNV